MDDGDNPGPFKRDLAGSIQPADETGLLQLFKTAPVTRSIVGINILVYCAMALLSHGQSLSGANEGLMRQWGSNLGPLTLDGQYFRLITSLFLHWDILHIAFNMYVLFDVGQAVENLYGSGKFSIIYLLAGVAGSLSSLLIHPAADSAGASGAVFGAFGALLVFLKVHEMRFDKNAVKSATRSIFVLLAFNLFFGMTHAYIDNAAHIGGFIGGIISGLAACPRQVQSKAWSAGNLVATVLLAFLLYGFLQLDIKLFR